MVTLRLFFVPTRRFVCTDSRRARPDAPMFARGTCLIRYHLRNAILMRLKGNDFILKENIVFLVGPTQTVGASAYVCVCVLR